MIIPGWTIDQRYPRAAPGRRGAGHESRRLIIIIIVVIITLSSLLLTNDNNNNNNNDSNNNNTNNSRLRTRVFFARILPPQPRWKPQLWLQLASFVESAAPLSPYHELLLI